MESAISWVALIGGFSLAGVSIGVLAWAFVKAADRATRRPYWLIERNQAGVIVNAPKLESRINGLEAWQQTQMKRDGAVGPDWGDANPDAEVPLDEDADREVGERG